MIRKAILGTLSVASLVMLLLLAMSFLKPVSHNLSVVERQTYFADAEAWRRREYKEYTFWLRGGYCGADWRAEYPHHIPDLPFNHRQWKFVKHGGLGLRFHIQDLHSTTHVMRSGWLRVPLWMPLALSCLYPVVAFTRGVLTYRRRRGKHRCPTCGYDLTGNTSGRCPECGKGV